MTLREALGKGYNENYDLKFQAGYVSRRVDVMDQVVHEAGGSRKGDLYVLLPCDVSTRFCYRMYLTAPEAA